MVLQHLLYIVRILQPEKSIKVLYQKYSEEVELALEYAKTRSRLKRDNSRQDLSEDYIKTDI